MSSDQPVPVSGEDLPDPTKALKSALRRFIENTTECSDDEYGCYLCVAEELLDLLRRKEDSV